MAAAFRTAHGAAREKHARLTASECPPMDELPTATMGDSARTDRDASGRFQPGNRVAAAKRVKAGPRGALEVLKRQGDEAARAADAAGKRYSSHRRAELTKLHGELSSGPSMMIETAGELWGAARYWGARSQAEGNPDYARLAAQLSAGARQAERDGWQLAALEAASRPKGTARFSFQEGGSK
jgi:hypothetical protein